jgi:heptosyltransferase-2
MKRVLVIQTAFIGDLIMSTQIYKGLKSIDKNLEIDVVVAKQSQSILANNPHISTVIPFQKKSTRTKIKDFVKIIRAGRKRNYDMAISLQMSLTSSLIMVLCGIPIRIGSYRQKLLTHPVRFQKGLHIIERNGMLLQAVKRMDFDLSTELFTSESDQKKIDKMIIHNSKYNIGIAPGSVRQTKMWPLKNFVHLIQHIKKEYNIYLIGGPAETQISQEICAQIDQENVIDAVGKLSLLESAELISRMDLMLTNDSAPLHMANAMNVPVFAFFGPTVKRFGCYPYREKDMILEVEDLDCRPCSKHGGNTCPEKHFRCMKDIQPDFVLNELNIFFKELNR